MRLSFHRPNRLVRVWFPLLILALWAGLYLPHLRTSPSWYIDESYVVYNGQRLVEGQPVNYALWNTFTHAHYPYQPLYTLLAGLFAKAAGGDIVGCRFLNTLLALAIAISIYGIGRRRLGSLAALFAALLFLTYDQSVIHFRYTFAHNGVAAGFTIAFLYFWRGPSLKRDLRGGCGLALAAGSHPLYINAALASVLLRLRHPRAWIPMFAPSAIYFCIAFGLLWWRFGDWIIEDAFGMASYYSYTAEQSQGHVLENIYNFVTQDWFHLGAYACVLLCCNRRWWQVPVAIAVSSFLLLRNRANLIWFYYQAVTQLPLLCIACGVVVRRALTAARRYSTARAWRHLARGAAFAFPTLLLCGIALRVVSGDILPRNAYFTTVSIAEVEECAKWINERTTADDLVICNPNISWLLHARTVHFLQVVAAMGVPTHGFEHGIAANRFRFNPDFSEAKFAVIGDIDARWTGGEWGVAEVWRRMGAIAMDAVVPTAMPMPAEVRDKIEAIFQPIPRRQWPIVWQGTNYVVLANPRFLATETP